MRTWTAEELYSLRVAYEKNRGRRGGWLRELAVSLDRLPSNLSRKAREIGIATSRVRSGTPVFSYPRQDRQRGKWSRNDHPRGMLGKIHTPETRARMSSSHTGVAMPPFSSQHRSHISAAMVRRLRDFPESLNRGKRGIGGKREDLDGRYFRSRYEANYARFLNWSKLQWEYETKTFWFEKISRGTRSYTPDFWVPAENAFHEVKGWMDPKSATKLKRMKKYHPAVKVIVIGADWFRAAERQGLCSLIPGWECRHTLPAQTART